MSRVLELSRSHGLFKGPAGIRSSFPAGVRGEFQAAVSWMQWYLRRLVQEVDSIADHELEWGYEFGESGTEGSDRQGDQDGDAQEPKQLKP